MPLTDERLREYAKEIISTESKCIEWGATAERSVEICVDELRKAFAENERLTPVSEGMPESNKDVYYLARLGDEHIRTVYRPHPWDVVSGWYLNSFAHLYTHWKLIVEPAVSCSCEYLNEDGYCRACGEDRRGV